jgi:hypothetical protein
MWRCNSTPTNIFLVKFGSLISKNFVLGLGSFYPQVYPVSFVLVPSIGMPLFKISRSWRITSSSRLRRRSSSRLRRLMPTAWKRFLTVRGQFLAPLMNGGVGNA